MSVLGFPRLRMVAFIVLSLTGLILLSGYPAGIFVPPLYLYGTTPFAYFFTFHFPGRAPQKESSMDLGVARAYRLGGMWAGTLSAVGDISKVFIPLAIAYFLFGFDLAVALALIFSTFLGTSYPLYLKMKGSLGATVVIWTLLILSPVVALSWGVLGILILMTAEDTYCAVLSLVVTRI